MLLLKIFILLIFDFLISSGLTQNYEKTNRKGRIRVVSRREGHKVIRV